MSELKRKLNIIDKNDQVIGQDTRENIHQNGLLHREIHIWVFNRKKGVLLQKRARDKDTYPGLLDASTGGHVEIGDDYLKTAVKELKEETGIKANPSDLVFITKMRQKSYDQVTNMTNNVIRVVYAFEYNGELNDLKIEKGKATSLEFWPLEKIFNPSKKDKKKFIPALLSDQVLDILRKIEKLVEANIR